MSLVLSPVSGNQNIVRHADLKTMDFHSQNGSSDSPSLEITGLSVLDDDLDEFYQRARTNTQRDKPRMQNAVSSNVQLFSKSRPKHGLALTMENLERQNISGPALTPQHAYAVHDIPSHKDHNPALRQWGSRARLRNDLFRHKGDSEALTKLDDVKRDTEEHSLCKTMPASSFDRTQLDGALSVSIDPLRANPTGLDLQQSPSPSRRATGQHANPSLDNIINREKATSLRGSTAPLKRTPSPHDEAFPSMRRSWSEAFKRTSPGKEAARAPLVKFEQNTKKENFNATHRRESRDLLRRLSRSPSATPSPKPLHPNSTSQCVILNGNADHRLATPPEDSDNDSDFDRQPKTPVVTGAWVETPTTRAVKMKKPETANWSARESVLDELKKPSHPKSALEAILQHSSPRPGTARNDDSGDATIDSLRNLMDIDTNDTIAKLDDDTLDLIANVDKRVEDTKEARQLEMEALQRMTQRLRTARSGLRDASAGMERVGKEVDHAEDTSRHSIKAIARRNAYGEITLSSLLIAACKDFLAHFYGWTDNGSLRLTWLGVTALIFLFWSLSELTLCEYYCHPRYAYSMIGFGVNPNAPRMPFVTTTIIFRPIKWVYQPLLRILWWLGRLFFGLFLDGPSAPGLSSSRSAANFAKDWTGTIHDDDFM